MIRPFYYPFSLWIQNPTSDFPTYYSLLWSLDCEVNAKISYFNTIIQSWDTSRPFSLTGATYRVKTLMFKVYIRGVSPLCLKLRYQDDDARHKNLFRRVDDIDIHHCEWQFEAEFQLIIVARELLGQPFCIVSLISSFLFLPGRDLGLSLGWK